MACVPCLGRVYGLGPPVGRGFNFAEVPCLGYDLEGTHHVVGFVLEDMAVIEVFAWVAVKVDDDAGDHAGEALDGVLPALFVWLRQDGGR